MSRICERVFICMCDQSHPFSIKSAALATVTFIDHIKLPDRMNIRSRNGLVIGIGSYISLSFDSIKNVCESKIDKLNGTTAVRSAAASNTKQYYYSSIRLALNDRGHLKRKLCQMLFCCSSAAIWWSENTECFMSEQRNSGGGEGRCENHTTQMPIGIWKAES